MNLLSRILVVGSLLTAVHTFAATSFEGKVTFTVTSEKGKSMDMNYSIKDQKVRMDMNAEGHSMVMITDLEKFEMLMLMQEQRMYMVMPLKKPIEEAIAAHGGSGELNTDIQRTGKTDTILGHKCEQILVTDKDRGTVTELWVANDLGTFTGLGSGGGSPFGGRKQAAAAKWEEVMKGQKGAFPLRVVSRNAKDVAVFKMEVTKIEPGSLPESMFTPPADFKRFQMPDFGALNPFKKG
jgi:Domain of unknown function (DUF4412)